MWEKDKRDKTCEDAVRCCCCWWCFLFFLCFFLGGGGGEGWWTPESKRSDCNIARGFAPPLGIDDMSNKIERTPKGGRQGGQSQIQTKCSSIVVLPVQPPFCYPLVVIPPWGLVIYAYVVVPCSFSFFAASASPTHISWAYIYPHTRIVCDYNMPVGVVLACIVCLGLMLLVCFECLCRVGYVYIELRCYIFRVIPQLLITCCCLFLSSLLSLFSLSSLSALRPNSFLSF